MASLEKDFWVNYPIFLSDYQQYGVQEYKIGFQEEPIIQDANQNIGNNY